MEILMNPTKISAIALLALGLSIAGCSKGDPIPSNTDSMPAASLSDAQQLAAEAQVHCSDPSQCSPSVALLVNTTPTSANQCTAFLIASDIAATNAHCIPDDLKSNGASCKGRIALAFPALGQYADVRTGCNEVISVSQNDPKSGTKQDYAFIRLDQPVQRPVLTITHSGFTDGANYTITKIDPYQGNGIPEGYMRQVNCKPFSIRSLCRTQALRMIHLSRSLIVSAFPATPVPRFLIQLAMFLASSFGF
jgi:hypothetical protein